MTLKRQSTSRRSQGSLSPAARSQRIETVTAALRRFRIVDDGTVSDLFVGARLPSVDAIRAAIKRLPIARSSVSASDIAHVIASDVNRADSLAATIESVSVPSLSLGSMRRFAEVSGEIVQGFRHAIEEQGIWRLLWNGARAMPERHV